MGIRAAGFQFGITLNVIGDDRLLQPAQMKWFEQREHSLGVIESPAHVSVGHDVDFVADGFANGSNEINVSLHAGGAVGGAPTEAHLHGLVAFVLVTMRLRRQVRSSSTL